MRRILGLAFGLMMLLITAGPAAAQATAQGAATLRAALDAWQPAIGKVSPEDIDDVVRKVQIPVSVSDWQVTPDGAGYRVEAPGFRLLLSEDSKPIVFGCDAERLRATPLPDGSFALDSDRLLACRVTGLGWGPLRIVAKSRHVTGSVDPVHSRRTTVTVTLDQVTIESDGEHKPPTLARLEFTRSATLGQGGRSDFVWQVTAEGLSVPLPEDAGEILVKRIALDCDLPDAEAAGMVASAVVLAQGIRAGRLAAADDPLRLALQDRLLASLGPKSSAALTAEGLEGHRNGVVLAVGSLGAGLAYDHLTQAGADLTLRFQAGDISTDPKWRYDAWTPAAGVIQISLQDFPLWQILVDSPMAQEEEDRLIQDSRMRFLFDTVHFSAPEAALDFSGAVGTDPDSTLGRTGTLQLRLTGIDGLVKALQADPAASQIAAGLSVVQVMGRQATLADGRTARDYDIVIDASGKILVNGVDVRSLIPKDL